MASVATNVGSDFASGNLAQGLVDSLNGFLPALALANATAQRNLAPLMIDSAAFAAAEANPAPTFSIPDFAGIANAALTPPPSSTSSAPAGSSGVNVTVTKLAAGGVALADITVGADSPFAVLTQNGETFAVGEAPATGQPTPDTIPASAGSLTKFAMSYVIGAASSLYPVLDSIPPASTTASNMSLNPVPLLDNQGNPVLNAQREQIMMPEGGDPAAVANIGALLAPSALDPDGSPFRLAMLAEFRQNGPWDFQRINGANVHAYVDYANVEICIYGASAGIPEGTVLWIANLYASLRSNYGSSAPISPLGSLSQQDYDDIDLGYKLYSSGLIGKH